MRPTRNTSKPLGRGWAPWLGAGSVLVLAAAIAAPDAVLADAPQGPTGGPVTEPSTLGPLLQAAAVFAGILIALAILVGLAFVVARIEGPANALKSGSGSDEPKRSRSRTGRRASVVAVVGAAIAGVLIGRAVAYQGSVGGEEGVIGAALLTAALVAALVGLVLVGLIATAIRHGHMSRAIATMLAAAGLLAIGSVGGEVTAAALGGTYRSPIVLTAPADIRLRLGSTSMSSTARDQGQAECRSEPDGRLVLSMAALDLGELGPGTLRGGLTLVVQPPDTTPVAEFFIDGGDLPEGSAQVSWSGPVVLTGMSADRTSGQLTFAGLPLSTDSGKPAPEPSAPIPAVDWPPTLSGSLSWTCQPWW